MIRIPFIKPMPKERYSPSARVIELEEEVYELRKQQQEERKKHEGEIAEFKQIIQDLRIQLAELQVMLFRTKKTKTNKEADNKQKRKNRRKKNKPRTKESFRKEIPKEEEVTKKEEYTLEACKDCGGPLEETAKRDIYIIDIPKIVKEVIKQIIHIYICLDCKRVQSRIPVPKGHNVRLGKRVRGYIIYYTYALNVSYRDIVRSLWDYYHIAISKGEIFKIQIESANKLLPTYNGIQDELLTQESLNADETSWKIKGIKNYLWGLCSPTTDAVLLFIGTRGKGNIEKLLKEFKGCLTTDCYAAYKNLINILHQICWVHILRNAKDLCNHPDLSQEQQQSAKDFYYGLLRVYQKLKETREEPFDEKKRKKMQQYLLKRLRKINQLLPCDTPKKLKNIKLLTQEYERELFACLQFKTALPENNLIERIHSPIVSCKNLKMFWSSSERLRG
jgi:hypothetical protein